MSFGSTLHDREAQASSSPISVGLPIGVKDVRERRRGNPDAGVLNLKLELRASDERYGAHFAYLGARLKDQLRSTKALIERYRPAQ